MLGVRVQPWALRYFATALASLAIALALMAGGLTYPTTGLFDPTTLAAVHLVTIGWLSLLMLGALHQFVPVIATRQLLSDRAPALTLAGVAGGLALMVVGFLALPGGPWSGLGPAAAALPTGGAAVVAGVGIALVNLGVTLCRSRPLPLSARYVAAGLAFLAATVLMGLTLAFGLAAPTALPAWLVAPVAGHGLPLHLLAGIAGWFTLTAMGVALKLLSMFTLAPEERGRAGEAAWALSFGGLTVAWLAGIGKAFAPGAPLAPAETAGLIGAAGGVALFLIDMARMYGARRRRSLELNARFGAVALAFLGLTLAAWAAAWAAGAPLAAYPPVVYLALFGWLSGLGLSQLYKIVPFLTWIERYGRRMGRERVPLVQDLVNEPRATPFFAAYFAAVVGGAAGLALGQPAVFRLAALVSLGAVAGIGRELLSSRTVEPAPAPPAARPGVRPPAAARGSEAAPADGEDGVGEAVRRR